jgi:alpha-tubulin suppressor-like RCC1 family protein
MAVEGNGFLYNGIPIEEMLTSNDGYVGGQLFLWGRNNPFGQLGSGDVVARSSPVQIGNLTNWKNVVLGDTDSFGLKIDGTLWAWGSNLDGVSGFGTLVGRSSPVQVGVLTNWKSVSHWRNGNENSASFIKTDGTLWSCGGNLNGQLGVGNTVKRSSPVQVGSLADWKQVWQGTTSAAAVKLDGTLWTWGANGAGQLGSGTITSRSSPVQVGLLSDWKHVSTCNHPNSALTSMLATKTDGTLWAWGANNIGQLGLGDLVPRSSPVQVGSLTNWKHVYSVTAPFSGEPITYATKTDGSLWAWGYNNNGELGLGDITPRSSPVQVGSLTDWANLNFSIESNTTVCVATKTDGTLWVWGYDGNSTGDLGFVAGGSFSSPVQIGSRTDWKLPFIIYPDL